MELDREGKSGMAWIKVASMSVMGRTPEPIGRACQKGPRGVKPEHRVLDVRGDDPGARSAAAIGGVVKPHRQVARVERHAEMCDHQARAIMSSNSAVVRSACVSMASRRSRSRSRGVSRVEDLERGLDLERPPDVGAEAIVPVAHEGPGVPAAERGDGLENRDEKPGVVVRGDRIAQVPSAADRIGRGEPHLEVKPQRGGVAWKAANLAASSSGSMIEGSRN